jgi:hypothetical protein
MCSHKIRIVLCPCVCACCDLGLWVCAPVYIVRTRLAVVICARMCVVVEICVISLDYHS